MSFGIGAFTEAAFAEILDPATIAITVAPGRFVIFPINTDTTDFPLKINTLCDFSFDINKEQDHAVNINKEADFGLRR